MKPEDVRKELAIDKHQLDIELESQPDLVYRVGMELARAISARDGQKEEIRRTEADAAVEARDKIAKPTEKAVQAEVEKHEGVVESRATHLELANAVRRWEVCLDAVKAKGYAIHKICDIMLSEGRAVVGQSERVRKQEEADDVVQEARRRRRRVG